MAIALILHSSNKKLSFQPIIAKIVTTILRTEFEQVLKLKPISRRG
jgi:hypothetical protein